MDSKKWCYGYVIKLNIKYKNMLDKIEFWIFNKQPNIKLEKNQAY